MTMSCVSFSVGYVSSGSKGKKDKSKGKKDKKGKKSKTKVAYIDDRR